MPKSALDAFVTTPCTGRGFRHGCDLDNGILEKSLAQLDRQTTVRIPVITGDVEPESGPLSISACDWANKKKVKQAVAAMLAQIEEDKKDKLVEAYDRAMSVL